LHPQVNQWSYLFFGLVHRKRCHDRMVKLCLFYISINYLAVDIFRSAGDNHRLQISKFNFSSLSVYLDSDFSVWVKKCVDFCASIVPIGDRHVQVHHHNREDWIQFYVVIA
jgi:hypothetical protein